MSNGGWIGVDFDATLATYDHWRGIEHVGAPIEGMVNQIKCWLLAGQEVKIFTARVYGAEGDGLIKICTPIWDFCEREFGRKLEITCVKDMKMIQLWDDRAIQVFANDGETFLSWAVKRWREEVGNRPLSNIHRRTLDDTWRQVIRKAGCDDPSQIIGETHDELLKEKS